jgi:excisionase family DNA binding protein
MHMDAQTDTQRLAYSLEESAQAIGLSRRTLYNLIEAGSLRTVKLGRRRVVPVEELTRILADAQPEPG